MSESLPTFNPLCSGELLEWLPEAIAVISGNKDIYCFVNPAYVTLRELKETLGVLPEETKDGTLTRYVWTISNVAITFAVEFHLSGYEKGLVLMHVDNSSAKLWHEPVRNLTWHVTKTELDTKQNT